MHSQVPEPRPTKHQNVHNDGVQFRFSPSHAHTTRSSHSLPTCFFIFLFFTFVHSKIELFSYGKITIALHLFRFVHRFSLCVGVFFLTTPMLLIYCNGKFVRHEIKENIGVKYLEKIPYLQRRNAFHHGFAVPFRFFFRSPNGIFVIFRFLAVDGMSYELAASLLFHTLHKAKPEQQSQPTAPNFSSANGQIWKVH